MNKHNRILLVTLALSATLAIGGIIKVNNSFKALNTKVEHATVTIEKANARITQLTKEREQMIQETKKIIEERDILKQEAENERMLKEAAEKKAKSLQSLSRGALVEGGAFGIYSRVDVKTGISAVQLNKAFVGTGLQGLGQAFVDAEQTHHVNAIFLAAIAAQESTWGTSPFARNRNNLFGFGSYDGATGKNTVYFDSKRQCIDKVAKAIKRDYLSPNGEHYNGATPNGINKKYCSSNSWDSDVVNVMNLIIKRVTR